MYSENLMAIQQEEMPDNSSLKTTKLTNSNSVHSLKFGQPTLVSLSCFRYLHLKEHILQC